MKDDVGVAKPRGNAGRCHHGWVMLIGSVLATAASGTGHSFSVAPFVDGWMESLHLSRKAFSAIWTIAMMASCLVAPFMGAWIDRYGSRRVLILCMPGAIGSLVWLAVSSTPVELVVALALNRVLNADTLPLVGVTTLNRWFVKHRGRASTLIGLMWAWLLEFPAIEIQIKRSIGARGADLVMSAYVGSLVTVCCIIWRDTPESIGLLPDLAWPIRNEADDNTHDALERAPLGSPVSSQSAVLAEVCFTRAQAVKTCMFWSVVLMQFTQNALWQGCHLHLIDVLHLHGLDSVAAGLFYTAVAVSRTVVSLVFGCLIVDRLGRRSYMTLVASTLPQAFVILLLLGFLGPSTWKPWMAFVLGIFYGVWGGIVSAADSVVYAQLFGREHLGSITGSAKGVMRISGVVGPLFFGVARDWLGSYYFPLTSLMVLSFCSGTMLMLAPLPQVLATPTVSAHAANVIGSSTLHEPTDLDLAPLKQLD